MIAVNWGTYIWGVNNGRVVETSLGYFINPLVTVLMGVLDAPGRAFAHASSLSVGFSRTEWIWERGQLVGLRASARCLKNRVAPPLGETELEIRYPLGARSLFDHPVHVIEIPVDESKQTAPSPVSPASRERGQSWDLYQASAVV